jgi:GNAT superfamily N-acetyltransferase
VADLAVRAISPGDAEAVRAHLLSTWGSTRVAGRGVLHEATTLPGYLAERDGELAGLLTYSVGGDVLEIVTLAATPPGAGAGTALVAAVVGEAGRGGCARVRVMTTNDNVDAVRFYQRRGFRLSALRPGGLASARRLKPEIPEVGAYGIPLRDEIDLELHLEEPAAAADRNTRDTTVRIEDLDPGDPRLPDVLPVLQELRPHLTAESFAAVYAEGYPQGLRYTAAYAGDRCVGVAGWRIHACTVAIRKLYVDDLVTAATDRSAGVGRLLLAELEERARSAGCTLLDLDSGVHRFDAHRFYLRERMAITAHHFGKQLDAPRSDGT